MAFTYNTPFENDVDRVRFALGDTDSSAAKFQDEEIEALLAEEGDWQRATLACIDNLVARLSVPNFRADWLQVDHASARQGYEALRRQLARKFRLGVSLAGGAVHTYRADSGLTAEPDYSEGRP